MKSRWINLIPLALVVAPVSATTLNAYLRNREGLSKYEAKAYFPAYQDFTKALADDPLNPDVHLNIARTFEANEELEKAEQAYKGVLEILPENSTKKFEALFNLAGVQAKNKKIGEALATYQAALVLDPDSLEVKTNIELLWQGGQGEGEGKQEGEQPQEPKDQKGRGEGPQPDQKNPPQQKKSQPKPFDSKELTPQDVKKILDEIKNQEQSIRADENDRGAKEAPRDKDW